MRKEALYELGRQIKMIVCDLDGTLLDSCGQISAANLAAVRKVREKGVFVTICSGRIHQMLYAYSSALEIRGPLVAANGAVIFDTETNQVLRKYSIPPDAALPLLRFCERNGMDYSALASRGCYFSRNSVRIKRFEQYNRIAAAVGAPPVALAFFDHGHSAAIHDDIYKILIYELRDGQEESARDFLRRSGRLGWTSSDKGLLDVSAPGVSKGVGVRSIAGIMGIPMRQVCVFGDYFNDISMMEPAGLPIAMRNAPERVKTAALAVTAGNDEDGVARGIEEYIL